MRIVYIESQNHLSGLQAGFSVSTRHFKKAVDRNRIKRLLRESYRLQKNIIQERLLEKDKNIAVFFIYTGKELPDFSAISEKMGEAIRSLKKIWDT